MILILKRIQNQNHFTISYYNIIKLFHGLDETLIDYSLQVVNFAVPTIYNGQQNIYKKYSSIWYLYTKAKILIDWGVASSSSE